MDNFSFSMTCEGRERLNEALALVWNARGMDRPTSGATHYAIRPAEAAIRDDQNPHRNKPAKPARMVFSWGPDSSDGKIALPFRLDAEGAADFAARWLAEADYGREPDHDGDNGRGWRIYVEGWGHVDNDHYAIVAVAPEWAMHGK